MPRQPTRKLPCEMCGILTPVAYLDDGACRACLGLPSIQEGRHKVAVKYGLDGASARVLIAKQNGICAICARPGPLVIDHDHETGQVRGMLCAQCNSALGLFGDSGATLAAAIYYLGRAHGLAGESGLTPVTRRTMWGKAKRMNRRYPRAV